MKMGRPANHLRIASTANEAIDAAAVEFRIDIKRLIAVRRFEIAATLPIVTSQNH
jgi:hypothetical protein